MKGKTIVPLPSEILQQGWTKKTHTKPYRKGYKGHRFCLVGACRIGANGHRVQQVLDRWLGSGDGVLSYNDDPSRKQGEVVALAVAAEVQAGARKAVPHGYKMAVRAVLNGINAKPTSSALRSLMEKRKGR